MVMDENDLQKSSTTNEPSKAIAKIQIINKSFSVINTGQKFNI